MTLCTNPQDALYWWELEPHKCIIGNHFVAGRYLVATTKEADVLIKSEPRTYYQSSPEELEREIAMKEQV